MCMLYPSMMSQNKKHKSGDVQFLFDSVDSRKRHAVTRAASEKGDKYDEAQKEIKELQAKLQQKKADAALLKKTIGAVTAEVVAQDPNWKHAQACLEYMKTNDSCTQIQACELMKKGQLPGDFLGVKINICQRYLSAYKVKLDNGSNICSGPGRPILLDEFETNFIGNLIHHCDMIQMSAASCARLIAAFQANLRLMA